MTGDETGADLVYDAWGRLVSVDLDSDASDDATYAYDALFRKIESDETEAAGGGKVFYHSQDWQVIEQREESSGDVEEQFIWSAVYVDAIVLRDRGTDSDGDTQDAGGERHYVLNDANFYGTAITGRPALPAGMTAKGLLTPFPHSGGRAVGPWPGRDESPRCRGQRCVLARR
jgi:hypothetical protein